MALDNQTAQQHLTPEERRELLRAFADRMLRKVTAMDDPEDLPGVERAMRVAAVIERVYSRCDRAERQKGEQKHEQTPDPRKLEAERATHEEAAIKARVSLASTLKWSHERRQTLGQWWDAAQDITQTVALAQPMAHMPASAKHREVVPVDGTDGILQAQAAPGSKNICAPPLARPKPPPA